MYKEMPPPELFNLWLASHPEDEQVGEKENPYRCPLANWLNEMVGGKPKGRNNFRVDVQGTSGQLMDGRMVAWSTPSWATAFMWKADQTRTVQITAERARSMLKAVLLFRFTR